MKVAQLALYGGMLKSQKGIDMKCRPVHGMGIDTRMYASTSGNEVTTGSVVHLPV